MHGLMMNQPLLISGLLEFAEKFHPRVEIVTRTTEGPIARASWRETAPRVRRLANALAGLGVKQGDRVGTLAWNTQRHLELYFAVSGMGAVLHTINPRLSPEQMKYVVDHAGDAALFFDITFGPLAARLAAAGGTVDSFIALTDAAHLSKDAGIPGLLAYEDLIERSSDDFAWPALDENSASAICYTSG